MARYLISYEIGHTETVVAADVIKDIEEDQYRFTDGNGHTVAFVPSDNVLSITQIETAEDRGYPYKDGDFITLGPEVFATVDGETICWRGENYTRQPAIKVVTG